MGTTEGWEPDVVKVQALFAEGFGAGTIKLLRHLLPPRVRPIERSRGALRSNARLSVAPRGFYSRGGSFGQQSVFR